MTPADRQARRQQLALDALDGDPQAQAALESIEQQINDLVRDEERRALAERERAQRAEHERAEREAQERAELEQRLLALKTREVEAARAFDEAVSLLADRARTLVDVGEEMYAVQQRLRPGRLKTNRLPTLAAGSLRWAVGGLLPDLGGRVEHSLRAPLARLLGEA